MQGYSVGDGDRLITVTLAELLAASGIDIDDYENYVIDFGFQRDEGDKVYVLLVRRPLVRESEAAEAADSALIPRERAARAKDYTW
jgi:hypothetical protein